MVDPGTAYAIVTAASWPIIQLGGLGASVVGPWLGFGAAGVASGSLAAVAQSSIPNVVAGSVFASMQSATAVSSTVGTIVGIPYMATAAGAVYGGYRMYRYFR